MSPQEYISSGKLELYVLDLLSPAERQEVITYAANYPEIAAEIEALEIGLEAYANLHAIPPPQGTYEGIKTRIAAIMPAPSSPNEPPKNTSGSNLGWWAGIAVLAAAAIWLLTERASLAAQLADCDEQLEELQSSKDELEAANTANESLLAVFQTKGNNVISLGGTDISPESFATVIYNPTNETTFFSPDDLPAAPTGKQYQLWALVDGNPVDMGIIALDAEPGSIVEVPHVEGAGAFAVTLEDEGGQPTPNLDQLYVIGNV